MTLDQDLNKIIENGKKTRMHDPVNVSRIICRQVEMIDFGQYPNAKLGKATADSLTNFLKHRKSTYGEEYPYIERVVDNYNSFFAVTKRMLGL